MKLSIAYFNSIMSPDRATYFEIHHDDIDRDFPERQRGKLTFDSTMNRDRIRSKSARVRTATMVNDISDEPDLYHRGSGGYGSKGSRAGSRSTRQKTKSDRRSSPRYTVRRERQYDDHQTVRLDFEDQMNRRQIEDDLRLTNMLNMNGINMNGTTTTDNEPFDNGISGGSSKRRKGRKGTNKSTKSNQSTKSTNDLTNRSKRSRNRSTKSKRSQRDKSDKKSKETATSQRDRQSSRDTAYSKRRERNASQTSKTSNRSQREYLKTWLCDHVGLPQYYDCFVDHGVEDFGMVTEITINELKLMGVHTKKHQLQIQKEITKLRNSIKARKSTDGSSLFDTV